APFCRVQGTIKPSADSDIKFEVWLPPEASWNGKVQGVGNGGFAGSLIYIPMTWALDAGYAVSGTDTGHSGGTLDSDWALGHPEKIIDFGWRAIHLTAEASKAIVADYYGKAPEHAYFSGCSDGGREALMEAQRFPNDYDGIVAGAPASNWTKLLTNAVWSEQAVDQPNSWLSPEKLSIVTKAVLADCHGEDGYVGDPAECHFHASNLVCKAGQSEGCLSEPEDAALTKIYSGAEDANGKSIFPGYAPGGEAGQAAWALWITGTDPKRTAGTLMNGFGTGYFANMVFDKPDWRIDGQNVSDDLAVAEKTTSQTLDATDPDLTAFKAAGGKLIQYHGWNDAAIPPQSSIDYYESVASTMGGIQNLKSFFLPAVHGARHGALRRRPGPQCRRRRLRPAFAEPRSRARRRRGPGPLGRTRRGARLYHRDALSRQRPGQRARSAAPVVSVSGCRPLLGPGRARHGGEL